MLPCENCEKRETCVAPCKELEDDLKRVEVPLREIPFSDLSEKIDFNESFSKMQEMASFFTEGQVNFPFKTQRAIKNQCLYMFYFRHMSHKEIAHSLSYLGRGKGRRKVTVSSVRGCIDRAKQELREISGFL